MQTYDTFISKFKSLTIQKVYNECDKFCSNFIKSNEKKLKSSELSQIYVQYGNLHRKFLRNYKKAETLYKKALNVNKNNSRAYFQLGILYQHKKKIKKIKKNTQHILKIIQQYFHSLYTIINACKHFSDVVVTLRIVFGASMTFSRKKING